MTSIKDFLDTLDSDAEVAKALFAHQLSMHRDIEVRVCGIFCKEVIPVLERVIEEQIEPLGTSAKDIQAIAAAFTRCTGMVAATFAGVVGKPELYTETVSLILQQALLIQEQAPDMNSEKMQRIFAGESLEEVSRRPEGER